jgi:ASC-1-like (ASCH) protein
MNYWFDVQEPYKTFLINWQKTIEWRLNKWKFADLQIWDTLQFNSWEEFIVENVSHYQSFKEMIQTLWRKNIIPDAQNDENARNVYYRFYTSEDENKYWVLAIQLKRIDEIKRVA